jgi:hypothetical protein
LNALELAHEPDHDAEDLQGAFGADGRVGLVLRAQDELARLEVEALQRELVVDDRYDDVALLGARALSTTTRSPSKIPASIIESPLRE